MSKKWREQNKEKVRELRKGYYKRHRTEILDRQKKRRDSNIEVYKKRERAAKRKMYSNNREGINQRNREWRQNNYERWLLSSVKRRAKRNGLDFNITVEDINIPDICPILGIPIFRSDNKYSTDNSPSIDRKDNTRGYVKGNVWIVSKRVNRLKNDGTLDEFRRLVEHWPTVS